MLRKVAWLALTFALAGPGAAPAREIEVTGRILASDGTGLRGASLELQPLLDPWQLARRQLRGDFEPEIVATGRSRQGGAFRIVAPEPGLWKLVVRHPRHLPAAHELKPLLDDRQLPDVELTPREGIDVRVVDPAGDPVPGLRIFVHGRPADPPGEGWRPETRQALTGDDGRALVPSGAGEIVTVAALGLDRALHHQLEPGARAVTLRLATPRVAARLLAADGQPAPGVAGAIRRPFVAVAISGPGGEIRLPLAGDSPRPLRFVDPLGSYGQARLESGAGEPALWLPAAPPVAGRVLDAADGAPIANAWVWTRGGAWRTDRRGAFSARLEDGGKGLAVAALGYRGQRVRLAAGGPAADQRLDVRLAASADLRGRVRDPEGFELGGAEIEATPRTEELLLLGAGDQVEMFRDPAIRADPRSARTDSLGGFRLADLAPGLTYQLEVRLAGYATRALTVPVERGETPENVEIVLEPGAVVSGRVVGADGQPIDGAEVELRSDASTLSPHSEHVAASDAAGRFAFTGVGQGTFSAFAEAQGFVAKIVPGLEVRPGQDADLGELVLEPTVTLFGRVTDPWGETLPGARIAARQTAPPPARSGGKLAALADRDGSFEIAGVSPTALLRVRASHDGFQDAVLSEIRADPETPLSVVLHPGIPVGGRVVDAQGFPVARASVELRTGLDAEGLAGAELGTATETDRDGHFAFPAQAPGVIRLAARSPQGRSEPVELALEPDRDATRLTLELRPAAALTGRVVGPDGNTVAGAHLDVQGRADARSGPGDFSTATGDVSGDDGRFRIGGLEAGSYLLTADHPDFERLAEPVELDDGAPRELELAFRQRRQHRPVSGRVVDPAGEGLSGAEVRLLAPGPGSPPVSQASSSPDGSFELSAPRDGRYAILALHPGYAPWRSPDFDLDEAGVTDFLVHLEAGGSITGEILGLGPGQRRQLDVVAHEPTHGGRLAFVDGAGGYHLSNLPPGDWRITARSSASGTVSERVALDPGERAVVDLRFEIGHRLSGLAVRDGEPITGANLLLLCPRAQFRGRVSSDASGWFVFDTVPAARCNLTLTDPRTGDVSQQQLEIAGDAEVTIELATATG